MPSRPPSPRSSTIWGAAAAQAMTVDAAVDHDVGHVHALGAILARHALRDHAQARLGGGKLGKSLAKRRQTAAPTPCSAPTPATSAVGLLMMQPPTHNPDDVAAYAPTGRALVAANLATGFSWIGQFISAASRPSAIEIHHMAS